jgi:hypothetical protein
MLRYSKLIYSLITLSIISTASIASSSILSASTLQENARQESAIIKSGIHLKHYISNESPVSDKIVAKLKEFNQQQLTQLLSLKDAAAKLDPGISTILLPKLEKLIVEKKTNLSVTPGAENNNQINFLKLRLDVAVAMIQAVNISAQNTLQLLQSMRQLAVEASSGVSSRDELEELNARFQTYKGFFPFMLPQDKIVEFLF